MVDIPPAGAATSHLFWLELFDHTVELAVDSCRCNTIHEAVALFEELIEQVGVSNE